MKKLFPILALSMVIGLFSSCIINLHSSTYKVYFNNDTQSHVYDWYLKDSAGHKYAISDEYCEIDAYHYDYISGIEEGDYKFYFCLLSTRDTDFYYSTQNFYHVEQDVTFYLSELTPYNGSPRSAVGPDDTEFTPENLVLKDSEGNVYPLKLVQK